MQAHLGAAAFTLRRIKKTGRKYQVKNSKVELQPFQYLKNHISCVEVRYSKNFPFFSLLIGGLAAACYIGS